jgi:hypothetical protein
MKLMLGEFLSFPQLNVFLVGLMFNFLHRWQKVLNPELVKEPWLKEVSSTYLWFGFISLSLKQTNDIFYFTKLYYMPHDSFIISFLRKSGHYSDGKQTWAKEMVDLAQTIPGRIGKQCWESYAMKDICSSVT